MPTFKKCKEVAHSGVEEMAKELICEIPDHELLKRVRIDFLFAYGERDDDGNLVGDALTHRGLKALGICSKVSLKDRAKGLGEAEIRIDGDWWEQAEEDQKRALLDHEMTHIQVLLDGGIPKLDRDGRPKIKMRKHDVEVGWFASVAKRHSVASQERIQAKAIADQYGQLLWPDLVGPTKSGRASKLELHTANA